jgi:hypothetical protein
VALRLVESCEDDDERRVTTMVETKRMTTEEVVGYLLEGEGLDFLRESLSWVVQQLMEAEVSELIGAERGERTRERLTHRNGYRPRAWSTRAGELLAIPKLRRGSYFPSFLEPRRRSEQALVSVVQEAYVAGVSTRKVVPTSITLLLPAAQCRSLTDCSVLTWLRRQEDTQGCAETTRGSRRGVHLRGEPFALY